MEFTVNIANLGKYNAGQLDETLLSFPTTTEQVQAALREIGVDGLRYQEIIILECRTSIRGLADKIGDFDHIDELNYLASRLAELTPEQLKKFSAAAEHDEYGGSVQDLINLTYNLDCYDLLPDVKTDEDYGRHLVDTHREFFLPRQARLYFDYESYGQCTAINEGGCYTPQGYIFNNRRTPFKEIYDGQHIPEQYKVFQYPIQQKIKAARSGRSRDSPARKRP